MGLLDFYGGAYQPSLLGLPSLLEIWSYIGCYTNWYINGCSSDDVLKLLNRLFHSSENYVIGELALHILELHTVQQHRNHTPALSPTQSPSLLSLVMIN